MPRMLLGLPGVRKRSAADMARLAEAKKKLYAGTLKPGELFEIVYGYPVIHPFERMAQLMAQRESGDLPLGVSSRPRSCKDCGKGLTSAGPQLKSQPLRCKDCGTKKRREHNQAFYAQGAPAPAVPVVPPDPRFA